MTTTSRPTWQHDDCPTWCISEHAEHDTVADRVHDSSGSYLTVVAEDPVQHTEDEVLVFLATFRKVGSTEDWIHLSTPDDGQMSLTLSLESAARLSRVLTERVAIARSSMTAAGAR
ncbi:DUF6907 domain-containing protein [Nocardioides sp. Bht2]|uniref:DUF6907 domain-containing protein n=1 Tax=Nocardioides sp. Bht2 TaxID=3392297 RepID=UPI0039B3A604